MLQLGLMEDDMHSAVETATASADLDDLDDTAEIENILQTASTTGKLLLQLNLQLYTDSTVDRSPEKREHYFCTQL